MIDRISAIHLRRVMAGVLLSVAVATGCGEGDPREIATNPPSGKPVLFAALGDSITAGSPLWAATPEQRASIQVQPDERNQYMFWAEERLGESAEFRNCGVPGERTDQIARRLSRCARGADVLIVQGGGNNLLQGRSVERAAEDLEAIVKRGKELGLTVRLAELTPLNNGYPKHAGEITRLNRRIRAIGRRERVRVLPFYETLEDPRAPGRMRKRFTLDGIHPNSAGHRRLGALIGLPAESRPGS